MRRKRSVPAGASKADREARRPQPQSPRPAGDAALHPALHLQQQAGNDAVQHLLQPNQTAQAAVRSPGRPLDAAPREFFESRLGEDLGDVTIHTGSDASKSAKALDAAAYTIDGHVVFDEGKYAPETAEGRRLIAHELAHVIQQRGRPGKVIQRQTNPGNANPPKPVEIQDTAADEANWRKLVDQAVRSQFNLHGSGLTGSNVKFLDLPQFAAQFPASELAEKLFNIFMDYGQEPTGMPAAILDFNQQPFRIAGPTPTTMSQLRQFIQDGISKDSFEGQSREYDVTTGKKFPPFKVKPRELVAAYVAGITDISGPRASRKIAMRVAGGTADVHTLVHEACHFYVSDAFRNMATGRPDGDYFIGDARISQILLEGFAEFFARKVMQANAATFGPAVEAYQAEFDQVVRLAATLGRASLEAAYFGGDSKQLKRVAQAVDDYKQTDPDLLIPGFVVDAHLAQAAPSAASGRPTP